MRRIIVTTVLAFSAATASAQQMMPANGMDHSAMAQNGQMTMTMPMASQIPATETGQSAFAAIAEITAALAADPETDWSQVNIAALREHLVDMELVFTEAVVKTQETDTGMRFTITGSGRTKEAIQNMTLAHAQVMQGQNGWQLAAQPRADGVDFSVTAPAQDAAKLRGLGFFGIMSLGMHHQPHHWFLASGKRS